jgi:hypothetical protein
MMRRLNFGPSSRRGTRDARGLMPLDELQKVNVHCCEGIDCVRTLTSLSVRLWEAYEECDGNNFKENKLILYYLYDATTNQLNKSFCCEYLHLVTGMGKSRVTKLRGILTSSLPELRFRRDELSRILPAHGNAGRVPHNFMADSLFTVLSNVVKRYTRSNPSTAMLETTSTTYSGVAGLIRAMEEEEPDAASKVHKSTCRRVIERVINSGGNVGLCSSNPDHNVSACSSGSAAAMCSSEVARNIVWSPHYFYLLPLLPLRRLQTCPPHLPPPHLLPHHLFRVAAAPEAGGGGVRRTWPTTTATTMTIRMRRTKPTTMKTTTRPLRY